MRLVGFTGKMGVGKSTAIEQLTSILGRPARLEKFAGTLYKFQDFIYQTIEDTGVYKRPADFVKDRKLLQWLGTDWGRDTLGEDIWVNIWKARVRKATDEGSFVVCDDVRFDNEAALIRALGGIVIKIERPDSTAHAQGGVGIANHASEVGICPGLIDCTISNSGTFEEFKRALRETYKDLGVGRSDSAA